MDLPTFVNGVYLRAALDDQREGEAIGSGSRNGEHVAEKAEREVGLVIGNIALDKGIEGERVSAGEVGEEAEGLGESAEVGAGVEGEKASGDGGGEKEAGFNGEGVELVEISR